MREILLCIDELNRYLFVPQNIDLKVISADTLMDSILKAYDILQPKYINKEEIESNFFSEEFYVK